MKRKAAVLVGLLLAAVGALLVLARPNRSTESTRVVVRLKWLHQAQFAGFYAADQLGYYAAESLSVDLLPGGVDHPAVFQVMSHAADFGVTGADQVLLARSQGHPVVALAVIYRQTPFTLFAKQTVPDSTLAQFRGRRIGVKYGGNEEVTYRAMLRAAGLDSAQVTEISVKYDMTPFYSDQVLLWPGYRINEPISAQERGVAVRLINPEDLGVFLYADVLFTRADMIAQKPDVVRRFVAATIRGWRAAVEDPDAAARFVSAYNPDADSTHERAMMHASIPLLTAGGDPVGLMSEAGWSATARILVDGGQLPLMPDVRAAYTNDFVPRPQ
jgi:ABC-type nitrate/sulfonate/bicarbonate transport system substrate-binding protein